MTEVYTDKTPMPFGTFTKQPIGTLPVEYLNHLWNNGERLKDSPLKDYISKNLRKLKRKNKHLVWK